MGGHAHPRRAAGDAGGASPTASARHTRESQLTIAANTKAGGACIPTNLATSRFTSCDCRWIPKWRER